VNGAKVEAASRRLRRLEFLWGVGDSSQPKKTNNYSWSVTVFSNWKRRSEESPTERRAGLQSAVIGGSSDWAERLARSKSLRAASPLSFTSLRCQK